MSYSSADRERALGVVGVLERAGIDVWIDRSGIAGGSIWMAEITQAIRAAPAVLVLCSRSSVASRNVRQELQLAWDHDKPVVPLLLEPVKFPDGVAYIVNGRQWVELHERPAQTWLSEIVTALDRIGVPRAPRVKESRAASET